MGPGGTGILQVSTMMQYHGLMIPPCFVAYISAAVANCRDESFEFLDNGSYKEKWIHLVSETKIALNCTIDRRADTGQDFEINIFTDASLDSYGAVSYIRNLPCVEFPEGKVSLIMAKGKVAPIKGNKTVPNDDNHTCK